MKKTLGKKKKDFGFFLAFCCFGPFNTSPFCLLFWNGVETHLLPLLLSTFLPTQHTKAVLMASYPSTGNTCK